MKQHRYCLGPFIPADWQDPSVWNLNTRGLFFKPSTLKSPSTLGFSLTKDGNIQREIALGAYRTPHLIDGGDC
jgi:hypothetical protein